MGAMSSLVYQTGTTLRIACKINAVDGSDTLVDPDVGTLQFRIYDDSYTQTKTYTEPDIVKESQGSYHIDYTTSDKSGTVYYEWYCEINGKPYLKRDRIKTSFVGYF